MPSQQIVLEFAQSITPLDRCVEWANKLTVGISTRPIETWSRLFPVISPNGVRQRPYRSFR